MTDDNRLLIKLAAIKRLSYIMKALGKAYSIVKTKDLLQIAFYKEMLMNQMLDIRESAKKV